MFPHGDDDAIIAMLDEEGEESLNETLKEHEEMIAPASVLLLNQ